MVKIRLALIAILLLVFAGFLIFQKDPSSPISEEPSPKDSATAQEKTDDSNISRPDPKSKRNPDLPPSILDQLNSAETSPQNDVRLLATLFADYATVFKNVPLGTHQEIVAALRGANSRKIQYIPDGHPSVNEAGEITDRWNNPFFFHAISRNAVEIVSAGPDGTLFTEDDVHHMPPHGRIEPDDLPE